MNIDQRAIANMMLLITMQGNIIRKGNEATWKHRETHPNPKTRFILRDLFMIAGGIVPKNPFELTFKPEVTK